MTHSKLRATVSLPQLDPGPRRGTAFLQAPHANVGRTANRFGLLALLLALAMRLVVPTGFMWETAAAGGAQLIPCSGMAPAPREPATHAIHHMAMPGGGHQRDHHGNSSNRECAFAGLAGALDLTDPVTAPAPPLFTAAILSVLWTRAVTPGRGLAAPPPPSRGPPAAS